MDLKEALKGIQSASRDFVMVEEAVINEVLFGLADLLEENVAEILAENEKDLALMDKSDSLYDRVLLDEKRISGIAASVREIAGVHSPVGIILEEKVLKSGLNLKKITVPFGVVGAIFEARPNVVIDTFALCFKSRNACVMKGGSQAANSNAVLAKLILKAIEEKRGEHGFMINLVLLLSNDREVVNEFLKMNEFVDVIIPRGSQGLIDFVRENSLIPVIETGRGVCHTFIDESGDLKMAADIVFNAKTQRPSVCNSLDTLIIHRGRLADLGAICAKLAEKEVVVFADEEAFVALQDSYPEALLKKASEESFGHEYLSLQMSIKTVADVKEAATHMNRFGSRHSEAIITANEANAEYFLKAVDAATVYVNASTRFTDGGEFGLGAEVGISTQKLHARGPMGIRELTTYKWLVRGQGEVRG